MAYNLKYQSEFESVRGELIRVDILANGFDGYATTLQTTIDQPVLIQREGEGKTYGIFGTACRVRFINNDTFNPADFVVNDFTELRAQVYRDGELIFEGFIAVEDVTHEYRVEPYSVELTFSDNIALLSEVEFPFVIDDGFTTLRQIFQDSLAQTGLEFDTRVFFMPKATSNDLLNRSFEQVKIVPRSYMENLQTFRKTKDVLTALLTTLRCRLYQLGGTWVIQRNSDYLYNYGDVFTGASYAFIDGAYSLDVLDCEATTLIPLSFSQTVTHKRPLVKVEDKFKLEPLPGIWNADLQELGELQSTSTVDGIRTDKYAIPFWTLQTGFTNSRIVVVTDTATESETDRYLEIPYLAEAYDSASAIRFNPILVSKDDVFDLKLSIRAATDSNFAFNFPIGVYLAGQSGTNYRAIIQDAGVSLLNRWQVTATTVDNFPTTQRFGFRGSIDMTEWQSVDLASDPQGTNVRAEIQRFPEDGVLYIKIAGFKNTDQGADITAWVKDIAFDYQFRVNDSLLIESQKHTTTIPIDSLNIDEKELKADDCVKYSAAGALYDKDDANTVQWERFDGDPDPAALGELNTTDQLTIVMDFHQFATFDGGRFLPLRLSIDLHRQQIEGEFQEMTEATDISYNFEYVYKPK